MSSDGSIEGINGKLYISDKDNALNKFFSNVFTTEDPITVPSFHVDKNYDTSLSSITINPSVVFEKLTSLKCGKTPGPDGWPIEVRRSFMYPLSILFIKSLESGILPQNWKTGHITPIQLQKGQQN